MAFTTSLLTSYLDDCNIKYETVEQFVSFEYDNRMFIGYIRQLPVFEGSLGLVLLQIGDVSPFEVKQYLKLINKLNYDADVVKYVYNEEHNSIDVGAEVPLDSSPELDDLVPGLVKLLLHAHDVFNKAIGK